MTEAIEILQTEMKKKIKKMIPDGWKLGDRIWPILHHDGTKYLQIELVKRTKYIKVTSYTTIWPKNSIQKVISVNSDGYKTDVASNIWFSKCEPATKAEIKAHKLGFHVGDEVYLRPEFRSDKPDIIEYFSFKSDTTGIRVPIRAYFNNGKTWAALSDLTKTPPKPKLFLGDHEVYIKKIRTPYSEIPSFSLEIGNETFSESEWHAFAKCANLYLTNPEIKSQIKAITEQLNKLK